ncbi:MAG: hypothetical protein GVY04_18010 [Cyanobacteria bacterium]|jgi:hypothetical protein|nr:hypothetical protein [Cyanobacteria bacterium GSL.Bin1]
MLTLTRTSTTQDLKHIQARIAALVRGIQSQPDNLADYVQALEVQLLLLKEVIDNLPQESE